MRPGHSADTDAPDEVLEKLSARLHDIYQAEAHRRGDVRHADAYDALPDETKEWDRVLARWILTHWVPTFDVREEFPPPLLIDGSEQEPGRKSHHATSDRAPVEVTFCMDDGCRYAAGHEGPHDITWQAEHNDGSEGA